MHGRLGARVLAELDRSGMAGMGGTASLLKERPGEAALQIGLAALPAGARALKPFIGPVMGKVAGVVADPLRV